MIIEGTPRREDPRYVDDLSYAVVVTWRSTSTESVDARARHILSKLAEIDRQLLTAPIGVAHIGMNAERDPTTSSLRRERNLTALRGFRAASRLVEVDLHYFLPRVSETGSWMIDETVDWNTTNPSGPILSDARVLATMKPDLDSETPAWELPDPLPGAGPTR